MRIIYLIKSFANKAGVERVISDKMNWLADHGYEVLLVTYEQGDHPYAFYLSPSIRHIDINTRFFLLSRYNVFRRLYEYYLNRKSFKRNLQGVVDKFNPDIIITTTYQLKLIDLILKTKTNAKMLIESHIACYKARKSGDFSSDTFPYYIAKLYDKFFLFKINRFNKLIVLTSGDANDWKKFISNVVIIPNPITKFPEKEFLERKDSPKNRVICVGRLNEQKGFDLLIKSFSLIADKCADWHVDIFGDGGDRDMLQTQINDSFLKDRIVIHSSVSDIYQEYMQSDFLVLSSRYEGYPLVLNEAMSCGLPCVAFNCKYGPEDAISHGENGLLVPNGDIRKLAESILWMIEHEDDRKRMSISARHASARYKKDSIMKEWVKLFDMVKQE